MTMFVFRLGDFLHWIAGTVVGLLLLECPAVIFAYSAFVSRMTSGYDVIKLGVASTALACLSWLAGRAMQYVLSRIYIVARSSKRRSNQAPPPQRLHRPVSCTKRAAPAMPTVALELAHRADALALEVIDRRGPQASPPSSIDERITAALSDTDHPIPFAELRGLCRVRTATLYEHLAALTAAGRLVKSEQGYRLTNS